MKQAPKVSLVFGADSGVSTGIAEDVADDGSAEKLAGKRVLLGVLRLFAHFRGAIHADTSFSARFSGSILLRIDFDGADESDSALGNMGEFKKCGKDLVARLQDRIASASTTPFQTPFDAMDKTLKAYAKMKLTLMSPARMRRGKRDSAIGEAHYLFVFASLPRSLSDIKTRVGSDDTLNVCVQKMIKMLPSPVIMAGTRVVWIDSAGSLAAEPMCRLTLTEALANAGVSVVPLDVLLSDPSSSMSFGQSMATARKLMASETAFSIASADDSERPLSLCAYKYVLMRFRY
jgi:hypothetical protein